MSTPFVQFNSACIRWPPCAPQGCALVRVILEVWLWTPVLGPGRDLIPFPPCAPGPILSLPFAARALS